MALATAPGHSIPVLNLSQTVKLNLQNQHLWTDLTPHTSPTLPRPLLSGVPPAPIYTDPDTDPDAPKTEEEMRQVEWVLPLDLRETLSVKTMSEVFDSLESKQWGRKKGGLVDGNDGKVREEGEWRGKRVFLGIVSEDSAVVYYLIHEGVVKPRQN